MIRRSNRFESTAAACLAGVTKPCLFALPLLLCLPVWLGQTPASSLLIFIPIGAVAWLLSRAEPIDTRLQWIGVFALALAIRLITLTLGIYLGSRNGLMQLGPDGQRFFARSLEMTGEPWAWPSPVGFGTADVGHYYLFSAVLRVLDSNLFGLRLLNAGIDAVAIACAYGIWTMVAPRWAALAGLVTALYTPLIIESTLDLWKDPSAIAALTLAIWIVLRAGKASLTRDMVILAALSGLALSWAYVTRMYWAFYLEVAAVFTAVLMATARVEWRRYRQPIVAVLLMLTVAQIVPPSFGWPHSLDAFRQQIGHVLRTDEMTELPHGAMDVLVKGSDQARSGFAGTGMALGLTLFRKIWGPYVWVQPPTYTARDILRGDYLMFPGIALWYVLLPSVVAGLLITVGGALRGRTESWVLVWLALYAGICLAQYLAIAQSFRQRDGLFPFLIVFAFLGWVWGAERRWWRPMHYAYALALGALAAVHLWSGNAVF